jgi:hypothetical protein
MDVLCPHLSVPPVHFHRLEWRLVRRVEIRNLLLDLFVFSYFSAPMPRGAGPADVARYVLRSIVQAAVVLGWMIGVWLLGQFAASYAPRAWRTAAFIAVVAAVDLPLYWLGRRIQRAGERLRAGLCMYCGYDLTANVSGVCPECGNAALRLAAPDPPPNDLPPRSAWERWAMAVAYAAVIASLTGLGYVLYRAWRGN